MIPANLKPNRTTLHLFEVLAWDGALYAAPLAADNVLRVFEGASGQRTI